MLPLKKGQTRKIRSVVSDSTVGITQRIMTILPVPTTIPYLEHFSFSICCNLASNLCAKAVCVWLAKRQSLLLMLFAFVFQGDLAIFSGLKVGFRARYLRRTEFSGVFSVVQTRETLRNK